MQCHNFDVKTSIYFQYSQPAKPPAPKKSAPKKPAPKKPAPKKPAPKKPRKTKSSQDTAASKENESVTPSTSTQGPSPATQGLRRSLRARNQKTKVTLLF